MLVRCIAIALQWLSLLVPEAGERERWRARWVGSLDGYLRWLQSRGLPGAEVRRLLGRYLSDGAAEAFSARWPQPALQDEWRRRLRRPWVAVVPPVAALAFGLWLSDGAAGLRATFRPLSHAYGDRLVTAIPQRSFFGKAEGLTTRQFELIGARTSSYAALTGYATRLQAVDGRARRVAYASPGLFGLLGMPEGGVYAAGQLGAGWVGRSIRTEGKTHRISGVWPRDFRPALARPDFWLPAPPGGLDTTMVAVLAPGVTAEAASRELRELLLSAPLRRGSGTPTTVVALRHGQAGLLGALWICFLALVLGLTLYAGWRALRRPGARKLEALFLAKAIPLLTGVFACGVAGFGMLSSGAAAGPFFVFWLTGIGCVLGIWWARRDQHLRCPECLARMTLSVQIGTHGAALLEGVGDEVLCEYGHGSLWLPGTASQAFGPEVWRSG